MTKESRFRINWTEYRVRFNWCLITPLFYVHVYLFFVKISLYNISTVFKTPENFVRPHFSTYCFLFLFSFLFLPFPLLSFPFFSSFLFSTFISPTFRRIRDSHPRRESKVVRRKKKQQNTNKLKTRHKQPLNRRTWHSKVWTKQIKC